MVLFYVLLDQQQTDTADNNSDNDTINTPSAYYRHIIKLMIAITKIYRELNRPIPEYAGRHKRNLQGKRDKKKHLN